MECYIHPLYGEIDVPKDKETVLYHIEIVQSLLQLRYSHDLQAYMDCLNDRLDDIRREEREE